MSYEATNCVPYCEDTGKVKDPEPLPLSSVMDQANNLATETLVMVCRIRQHLFGVDKGIENEPKPQCFRDVLTNQRTTLGQVVEELARIMDELGV
nr:MAG TPA: hypothetical protein [Caudoviricetes sp.]